MNNDYIFQLEMKLHDLQEKYARRPNSMVENQIAYYTAMLLEEERYERECNEAQ